MLIDVWCTMPHYSAHLRPLYDALPADRRGSWYDEHGDPEGGRDRAILVAAYRDLPWISSRYARSALVEHGIGQSYTDNPDHPGYPGGIRQPYDLLLAPGPHVADPAARAVAYVGCTTAERWRSTPPPPQPPSRFAVSFHWDCPVSPEAGTGAWEYLPHLAEQATRLGGLLVHAHPRIQDDVFEQLAALWNVTPCPSFDTVLEQAAVYAVDNSSTLFEFAALDRPVVVLNPAVYRRHAQHGKRFWQWAGIGEHVNDPAELATVMLRARDADPCGDARRALLSEVYEGNTTNGVEALLRLCV